MNDFENQETTQDLRQKRRASWAAGIFTAVGLAFLGLSIYIVVALQDGRFDLADKVLMPVTALMFLTSLVSYILIQKGRVNLGAIMIFGVSLVPPVIATLLLQDFAPLAITFVVGLAPILIFRVLPGVFRRSAIIAAVVTIFIIIGIEIWNPSFRDTSSAIVGNFIVVVIPLAALGLIVYSLRRVWQGSLRNKLITSFLLVTVIPLLIVGAVVSYQTYNAQIPQALETQSQIAQRIAEQIKDFILARESELRALTDIRGLASLSPEEQNDLLSSLLAAQNLYDELILVDGDGQEEIYLSRLNIITPDDLTSRAGSDEFEEPKASGETYFSPVQFDEVTGEPYMVITIPVFDLRSGDLVNALIANFRFKTIWDLMAQADVVGSGIVYMVGDADRVVAHANPSVVLQGTQMELPLEDAFTTGIDGSDVAMALDKILLSGQEFTVVAELSRAEATALATSNLTITIIAVVIAIAAAAAFGTYMARNISTPIVELAEAAETVSAGDFSQQVKIDTQDEIGTLARAFNSMTTQLISLIGSLEQQVTERTRALETSTEVSRRLSTILDQDQLVREVVEQLRSAFGYYHAQIYLYDESKQSLNMVGGTGEAGRAMLASGHKIEPGRGLVGRAAQSNQVVLIPDVSQAEGWLPNPLLSDTKAEVAVPIAVGQDVLGVLDVQHNVTDGLTSQDADLIQAIGNQVAIAVQNAQAYTRSQHQATQEAHITAISQRIQSATTIDDVLKIAVSELGQALETQQASVELQVGSQSEKGSK